MVSLSSLVVIDDFSYDDKGYCLRGVITGLVFRMGDQVRITVDRVDTAKRQIDYSVVGY
jgi:exoribonuclease R